MTFTRLHKAWGAIVSGAILATGGMAMAGPDGAARMSGLKVSDIAGYDVLASARSPGSKRTGKGARAGLTSLWMPAGMLASPLSAPISTLNRSLSACACRKTC